MSKKDTVVNIKDDQATVASFHEALVVSPFLIEDQEATSYGIWAITSLVKLEGLGRCEKIDEVKLLLGEPLMWLMFLFRLQESSSKADVKCKWLRPDEWSHRGPDRTLDEWTGMMYGIREKTARLGGVLARQNSATINAQQFVSNSSLLPLASDIVNDRESGDDLRNLMAMYKLSPRECFESVVIKRKSILEAGHKKAYGKHAVIKK